MKSYEILPLIMTWKTHLSINNSRLSYTHTCPRELFIDGILIRLANIISYNYLIILFITGLA